MENITLTQVTHTDQIGELMGALAKAQSKITSASKGKQNPFFKSKYADLPSVWEACKEPLSSNALAVVQTVEGSSDQLYLITILGHSSGQWIKSKIPLILAKKDPQTMGSCITYARRYALAAMVGVYADDEDDDAEVATTAVDPSRKSKHTKIEAHKEDISVTKVNEYLESVWGSDAELFRNYMEEIKKTKNWNYKECIEAFEKNQEYTLKNFANWVEKNKGAA